MLADVSSKTSRCEGTSSRLVTTSTSSNSMSATQPKTSVRTAASNQRVPRPTVLDSLR